MITFSVRPLARVLAAIGLAAALPACKGLTSIDAGFQNETGSDTVYALNSAPPGAPNAFRFYLGVPSRADQGLGFDIAFDIDKDGKVVVIPVKAVATIFASPPPYSVALQTVPGAFATVLEAPKDGYRPDTAATIGVGETLVAEVRDFAGVCITSLKGQTYYSKLSVLSVDLALRRIAFIVTVNRNCGFRSFAPGIPQN